MQNIAIVFDASVFAIFGALLNGLTMYPIQKDKLLDFEYFERFIKENKINIINMTVSLFNKFIEYNPKIFSETRVILIGGEAVLPKTVNVLRKNSPHVEIVNVYGPTENSDLSSCHIIEKDYEKAVPIGMPVSNSTCYILDKNQNLLPIGVTGEIYVGGDGIALGYLNNEKLTQEKFIPNKFGEGKLYKTGDLGYWEKEGIIQFVSRIDDQVKIRGFRIELKEIETKILEFGNIKECAVIISESNSTKILVACIGTNAQIDTKELSRYLKTKLPSYMVPSKYICMETLPLNINGKLDTKQLLQRIADIPEEIIEPKTDTQKGLVEIWKEVLGIENIGINQNFFEIGGDSLTAINLSSKIYSKFSVQISVKDILENPIIEDLSVLIDSNETLSNSNNLTKAKQSAYYPLSAAQKRIYYSVCMDSDNSILYNIPGGVIFDKIPDIKKLESCLSALINRHESLRTYFETSNNEIVQKVQSKVDFKLDICDAIVDFDNLDKEFNNFVQPFDLSKPPLFRAKLFNLKNGNTALFIDMHHIISDGTSVSILTDELCKLYNGEKLDKLNITYKDFAKWENDKIASGKFKQAEDFWVNQFKNDIPVLDMPTNYSRPAVKSFSGNKVHIKINETTTNKINALCKGLSITPYMLFLTAYYILLYKYTNQNDIVIGSPIVGRNTADLYSVIGMFVNSLPMRAKIDSHLSFKDFLNIVKSICLKNYEYQDYPFDELVNKLNIQRDTSRNPLFDVMFIYQNNGNPDINFSGISSKYYIPDTNISKFDLSLEIAPEDNFLNLSFEYSTGLFNKDFIKNLSNHYINIIDIILENTQIKISEINMLSKVEQNKILYEFNNTKVEYPKEKTIATLFEEQVEKTPDNIAIVFEKQKLTYKELNEKANSLAHYLRDNEINRNDLVGIMVNRSLEMIISILAVLKSGGAYIPIDPEYPEDRIKYMLNNSNAKLLLTQKKLIDNIEFDNKICVDLSIDEIYKLDCSNLNNVNTPEDLIYVIYTSGSTGLPKGVMLKNSNIVNFIYAIMQQLEFPANASFVSLTTISFDIFVLESLLPLLNGMKTIIASESAQTDVNIFNDLCVKNNVDVIQTTPSRIQAFLYDVSSAEFLKKVKYMLIGGEPFPNNLLERLHSIYSGKIFNMYGPTETAVWSSIKELSTLSQITIGTPIANTQMYVLDQFNNPLPISVPGELFISGDGLARGYLNNENLTNKVFINNPFTENSKMYKTGDLCKFLPNGEIEYLERIDNQIKIRGLRIELGEIESKILSYPNIKNACVIKQTINNRDFISAYFTVNKRINISELRKYLSKYLPKYMIPSYFTVLDDFPYTPNGKINKKMLPLPNEILKSDSSKEYVAPKTDLEKKFVNIWESILNIKPIGINDNFFELGGDSILAMNLNIELKNITNSISYSDIFKFPTISELIKKASSNNDAYDFNYMEKNYNKYANLLNLNTTFPSVPNLEYKTTGNILLTGATGFLGMHILDSFIKNEKGNVYCLIREEPGLTAQAKLHQKLNYYFGNKYDKLIGKRIFAITGYITESGFGLSQDSLLLLANNIDIVINTAARVSHYGNYSDFYNTNVKSVKNMIDFCKSFNKKLYHVSTLSISGNSLEVSSTKQNMNQTTYFNESNLYIGQSLENVYIRSKFEAECLVLDSILDGLDAYILRVGNLMPRLKDGIFQENVIDNAFINRILSFIKIGAIPDYLQEEYLEFTPIDVTANAIIKLITHPHSSNRIFHLFNHNHVYINKCIKYFKLLNSELKILPENEFKKIIKSTLNNKKKKEILNSLINDLDSDLHLLYKTDIIVKSDFTIKYLSEIGFSWPKINDKYIMKFIEILRRAI